MAVKEPASSGVSEENAVKSNLHKISINARRRAYRKNATVTIIRNGKIIVIHSNRKVKTIGAVKKVEVKVDINKPIKIR